MGPGEVRSLGSHQQSKMIFCEKESWELPVPKGFVRESTRNEAAQSEMSV